MKLGAVLLAFAAVLSLPSMASDRSVFGYQLGAPFTLPACNQQTQYTLNAPTCFQTIDMMLGKPAPAEPLSSGEITIVFAPATLPTYVKGFEMQATVVDGNLERIAFATGGVGSQIAVLAALTQKYGTPTTKSTRPVQNGFGAKFDVVDAAWSDEVSVTFRGVLTALDEGQVAIETAKGKQAHQAALDRLKRPMHAL